MNNGRDCPHGRQVGKCDTCDLITAELELEKVTAERNAYLAELQKANAVIIDLQRNPPNLLESCLRQVRADAVDEFMNKAMHEIANSYTSSTPVTPWESGMNSMLAMFAKYTHKYLKILRNNESTSILAGKE